MRIELSPEMQCRRKKPILRNVGYLLFKINLILFVIIIAIKRTDALSRGMFVQYIYIADIIFWFDQYISSFLFIRVLTIYHTLNALNATIGVLPIMGGVVMYFIPSV